MPAAIQLPLIDVIGGDVRLSANSLFEVTSQFAIKSLHEKIRALLYGLLTSSLESAITDVHLAMPAKRRGNGRIGGLMGRVEPFLRLSRRT